MTEQKVMEMSKKQMSISDKNISNEDTMKDSLLVRSSANQKMHIRSLNDFSQEKVKHMKNSYFNSSITGTRQT
jgi:hypothetical protein